MKKGDERKGKTGEKGKELKWGSILGKKEKICKKKRHCLACYRKGQTFKGPESLFENPLFPGYQGNSFGN